MTKKRLCEHYSSLELDSVSFTATVEPPFLARPARISFNIASAIFLFSLSFKNWRVESYPRPSLTSP